MATRRGPRFKECRWLGVNACGHPKAMKRAGSPSLQRKGKPTEYRLQMVEKQKIKAYYGIYEKQLLRYYNNALRVRNEKTGSALLKSLETRLDNLVYRIGFANSIRMARQMVTHGHILLNGKHVNIPSHAVYVGDVITLEEKARSVEPFVTNFREGQGFPVAYIERDFEQFTGRLVRMPEREEIPVEIDDQLVIEFYSR